MEKIKAYEEILNVLDKHDNIVKNDYSIDIRDRLSNKIKIQKLANEFGIEIKDDNSNKPDYIKLSEYCYIGHYGEKYNRVISWSDDGSQPSDEFLYVIYFPCGAYTFDEKYPNKTFNKFFNKLKSFGPKYSDTQNNCLYFDSKNAKEVHENFGPLFNECIKMVDEELRCRKIEELKKQLEKLEGQ